MKRFAIIMGIIFLSSIITGARGLAFSAQVVNRLSEFSYSSPKEVTVLSTQKELQDFYTLHKEVFHFSSLRPYDNREAIDDYILVIVSYIKATNNETFEVKSVNSKGTIEIDVYQIGAGSAVCTPESTVIQLKRKGAPKKFKVNRNAVTPAAYDETGIALPA